MSFRAIWVDEGNDADYAKLRANGITAPYYSVRDPRVTKAYLEAVRAQGFTPGIYAAWNWPETGIAPPYTGAAKGAAFATWVSRELQRIAPATAADFPLVCLNAETHDAPYLAAMLRQWRKHRQDRVTDWTLEGFQGGWIDASPDLGAAVNASGVGVVPQFYRGNMSPLFAGVILDLLTAGIPADRLMGFYDAADLPYRWHGYAFTQGRLP